MAADFLYTNPEAARQAIARMQLEAAAAENQSRERIAREQTQAQKYATQSQISAADKDRDVRKEDLALRRDIISANAKLDNDATRDAATKARAKLQFSSIIESLNNNTADPLTAKELETLLSGTPDLTEDHRTAARNLRADIVKLAKSNAAAGERAAKNYQAELKGKGITGKGLDMAEQAKVYERMAKDPNIIFDRATGSVTSAFRQPREDFSPGPGTPTVPTIGDIRARIGGGSPGAGPAFTEVADTPPTMATLTAPAPQRGALDLAGRMPAGSAGYDAYALMRPQPRVSDFAAPAPVITGPPQFALPPAYGVPGELYGPPNLNRFMPRVSDLQGLRPDLIPMDDYYYQQ